VILEALSARPFSEGGSVHLQQQHRHAYGEWPREGKPACLASVYGLVAFRLRFPILIEGVGLFKEAVSGLD
jgi:hypothetical protein